MGEMDAARIAGIMAANTWRVSRTPERLYAANALHFSS